MKRITVIITAIIAISLLTACGSSKETSRGIIKNESDECIVLQEEKPNIRGWGEATNSRISYARNYAEGQARGMLARTIAAKIKTATSDSDLQWAKFAATLTEGQGAIDEGSKLDGATLQVAMEVIENTPVIKTSQYTLPNGQYRVYVCVEYQGGTSKMASRIDNRIKQMIPDEERIKMEYQFQKFRELMEEELAGK